MRKLIYILATMIGLCMVGLFAVFMLLSTENGSRWVVSRATAYVPGKLAIGRIQGSLLSGLNLYKVDQYMDQNHIQIEHVELNLKPASLLKGTVLIKNLSISDINYTVKSAKEIPVKDTIAQPRDISFPFSVAIEKAMLNRINFNRNGIIHPLKDIRFAGRMNRNGLFLKRFEAREENLNVNLQGHMGLHRPYPFQAKANWNLWLPSKVKVTGRSDISGDISSFKFTQKLIEPLVLTTRGEIKIGLNSSETGKTKLYDLKLKGNFSGPGIPPTNIETLVQTDLTTFQIDSLSAHTLKGSIKAIGHIVLQPEPKAELMVSAIDIDPGAQWSGWHGNLAFNTRLQAKFEAGTPTVLLHELKVDGHLIDHPFQSSGDLVLHGTSLITGALQIHLGDNTLNVSGAAGNHMDVKFDVDARNPFILWPKFRGHLKGKGIIKGPRNSPFGIITLEGSNMGYGDYAVQSLHSDFTFDSNNLARSTAKVKLVNLRVGDEVLSNVTLNAFGSFGNHHVSADFVFPSARTDIEFSGNCLGKIWKVDVDKASFSLIQNKIWKLRDPIHLEISYAEIKPFNACWILKKNSICTQSSWNEESGWKSEGDISNTPLNTMIDLLKEFFKEEHLKWGKAARYY